MGFFDMFRNRFGADQNNKFDAHSDQTNHSEIQEEDFVDYSEPISKENSLQSSMPIDEIYHYLQINFENKGYEDALSNPDTSYRDMNKKHIISNLRILFKQVKQIYLDNLNRTEFHIKSRSQAGLVDIVDLLINRKVLLDNHLEEITKMEDDLEKEEDYMIGMLLSYERGFLRGLAALSLETLNINR